MQKRGVIAGLVLLAACAEPARYVAVRTVSGDTKPVGVAGAISTAKANHYEVVSVDPVEDSFVALAARDVVARTQTALFVHVSGGKITPRGCSHGRSCLALSARVRVQVMPVVYRDGRALAPSELPDAARAQADELSWKILSASQN